MFHKIIHAKLYFVAFINSTSYVGKETLTVLFNVRCYFAFKVKIKLSNIVCHLFQCSLLLSIVFDQLSLYVSKLAIIELRHANNHRTRKNHFH